MNNNWLIKNVKQFWQTLDREGDLTEEQKQKICFFVPNDNFQYSPTSEITYFIGTKITGKQAIVCIHNDAFMYMGLRIPQKMFIIYDPKTIKDIELHISLATKNMKPLQGIDEFIKYLEM